MKSFSFDLGEQNRWNKFHFESIEVSSDQQLVVVCAILFNNKNFHSKNEEEKSVNTLWKRCIIFGLKPWIPL